MDKLTGDELVFYNDQRKGRKCRLSEVVDSEYENERKRIREMHETEQKRIEKQNLSSINEATSIEHFINDPEFDEVMPSALPNDRQYDKSNQTKLAEILFPYKYMIDEFPFPRPEIRKSIEIIVPI